MSLAQQVFGWLSAAQGFALFGTLLWRRHYRRMPVFVLFVGGVLVFNVVYALHPTWETYMLLQIVTAALRFGLGLELTNCIFGAFPAAAVTARRVMLLILVATAVTAVTTAPPDATYTRMHAESVPRMASAVIWMVTALAALVLWYRLPLAPLPRAILMGYAPYLLLFTILMSLLFEGGSPHVRLWVGYLDPLAFFVLFNYWLRVAWRTVPESAPLFPPPAWPPVGAQAPGRVTA
jgi:hypothetical protein